MQRNIAMSSALWLQDASTLAMKDGVNFVSKAIGSACF
jgi:hypothetical protein